MDKLKAIITQQKILIILVIGLIIINCTAFLIVLNNQIQLPLRVERIAALPSPAPVLTTQPSPTLVASPSAVVSSEPKVSSVSAKPLVNPIKTSSKIIFGIGSQAGPAMDFRIVKEAPVKMLTSWYNGPKDLEWMRIQENDLIPRLYQHKYIVHLITWTDLPEHEIQTPYGPACGRPYPVSAEVVEDMKQLAQIYEGNGPLYLTLFTEFQTFTCIDNNWIGNENYYQTLKDNFRKIKAVFHQYAPQSKVALSWGGWISRYDDPVNQGGRSLFAHFADVLVESDFTAFQAMESDTNIQEMLDMTRILGSYKKPVMLAHYKPHSNSQQLFEQDMQKLFTDEVIGQLTKNGLFAFSFMDNDLVEGSENAYQLVKNGITKYGN